MTFPDIGQSKFADINLRQQTPNVKAKKRKSKHVVAMASESLSDTLSNDEGGGTNRLKEESKDGINSSLGRKESMVSSSENASSYQSDDGRSATISTKKGGRL